MDARTKKLDQLMSSSSLVRRASELARKAHARERRKAGEPYFFHLRAVAETLLDWNLDDATIAAAFLHQTIRHPSYSIDYLKKEFGPEVGFLVESVEKMGKIPHRGLERDLESLRKFILHLSQDVRVVLVRLADRLHNLKTLYILPADEQKKIALETMEIYAPLAYRLGMYKLGGELEDFAFPYIYPQEYKWLIKNVKDLYDARERYIEKFKPVIEKTLTDHRLTPVAIHYRAKRYASLYKKLLRYDMDMDKIYDLVALRVIVKTIDECYRALSLIHQQWAPAPEGFDDYIKHPKPNGYKSIHTNVIGPRNKIIEIQIRTEQMQREAEIGVAARFAYERLKDTPEYALNKQAVPDQKSSWIRRLVMWRTDPKKYGHINIFEHTILVLSPKQDIVELPKEATVLDFAYKVHTDLGRHASGALINGVRTKIDAPLKFGDIVEVLTAADAHPEPSWLKIAATAHARTKIAEALERAAEAAPVKKQTVMEITVSYRPEEHGILKEVLDTVAPYRQGAAQMNENGKPIVKLMCTPLPDSAQRSVIERLKKIPGVLQITVRERTR